MLFHKQNIVVLLKPWDCKKSVNLNGWPLAAAHHWLGHRASNPAGRQIPMRGHVDMPWFSSSAQTCLELHLSQGRCVMTACHVLFTVLKEMPSLIRTLAPSTVKAAMLKWHLLEHMAAHLVLSAYEFPCTRVTAKQLCCNSPTTKWHLQPSSNYTETRSPAEGGRVGKFKYESCLDPEMSDDCIRAKHTR